MAMTLHDDANHDGLDGGFIAWVFKVAVELAIGPSFLGYRYPRGMVVSHNCGLAYCGELA